jgi:putative PIN family toxin of toxin-antitoxin system
MVRLVLDTCVLVAALRSDQGASRAMLMAALDAEFDLVLSTPLVLEYEAVLTRPEQLSESGLSTSEVSEFLEILCDSGILAVRDHTRQPQLRDANDEMVLEAAIGGRANGIVTFNIRHFAQPCARIGIELMTPRQALLRIKQS